MTTCARPKRYYCISKGTAPSLLDLFTVLLLYTVL